MLCGLRPKEIQTILNRCSWVSGAVRDVLIFDQGHAVACQLNLTMKSSGVAVDLGPDVECNLCRDSFGYFSMEVVDCGVGRGKTSNLSPVRVFDHRAFAGDRSSRYDAA